MIIQDQTGRAFKLERSYSTQPITKPSCFKLQRGYKHQEPIRGNKCYAYLFIGEKVEKFIGEFSNIGELEAFKQSRNGKALTSDTARQIKYFNHLLETL